MTNSLNFVLTNGFKETQLKKITNCNLSGFFEKIFTSEDAGCNKPHKEMYAIAINTINARKEDCLMIGDDIEVDIKGAQMYGINQVFFNPKFLNIPVKPTYTIHSLKELENIL